MDASTLLIIGGAALVGLLVVVVILNRSWGNFPRQAGGQLPYQEPPRPSSWEQSGLWAQSGSWDAAGAGGSAQASAEATQAEGDAAPISELLRPAGSQQPVLITHPMVRQAAENALQRGGPGTQYIIRDGNDLYFTFEAIPDALQREMAYNMMRRFQAGEDVNVLDMFMLVRQLFKG